MGEKKSNLRDNPKLKQIGEHFGTIMIGIFIFQVNMLFVLFMFKKSFLMIHLVAFLLVTFFFLFFKDFTNENQKKLGFKLYKIAIVIGVMALFDHVVISGLVKIQDPKLYKSLSKIIYFIDFSVLITSFAVFRNDNFKMFLENIYEISLLDKIIGEQDEEVKLGDSIIGKDIATGKPVILPLKDRFLHMLILGPTGCGKTSQSVIPMINRDMQNSDMGITVIEPKGDLAEKIYAMAKYYNREVMYFNPILPDCPYFNPLFGNESNVIENMATTFKMLNPDSPQFFQNMSEDLIRKSIKVLKRLYNDDATLIHLDTLIHNHGGAGKKIVMEFSKLPTSNESIAKENSDIALWFLNDYFTGASGDRGATKTYEHCSGIRSQVAKLVSNEYLRKVLNPPPGRGSDVDFDRALEEGTVITISTAQGALRDLGRFLGYFIILQLQSAVFRRPGNENTRRANMLFIDEFQVYSNPGFADMLTQGRSYRVASHLATQARSQMAMGGGKDGKNFVALVSTNARNKIIYPGISYEDAKYYSDEFGEIVETTTQVGITRQKFNPLNGFGSKPASESLREIEEVKARFSPSDLIYKKFGEITYCLIKDNSIQTPGISKIEYIPKEINDKLDKMVEEYNEKQFKKYPNSKQAMEQSLKEENFPSQAKAEISENAVIKDIDQEFAIPDPLLENNSNPSNNFDFEEEENDFVEEGEASAKTKNGIVISKDDYRIGNIGFDLELEDEEDDLI